MKRLLHYLNILGTRCPICKLRADPIFIVQTHSNSLTYTLTNNDPLTFGMTLDYANAPRTIIIHNEAEIYLPFSKIIDVSIEIYCSNHYNVVFYGDIINADKSVVNISKIYPIEKNYIGTYLLINDYKTQSSKIYKHWAKLLFTTNLKPSSYWSENRIEKLLAII